MQRLSTLRLWAALAFAIGLGSIAVPDTARAIPPTPPAKITLPSADLLMRLQPTQSVITVPVQIAASRSFAGARLIVRSRGLRRTDRDQVEINEIALGDLSAGITQTVDVPISAAQGPRQLRFFLVIRDGDRDGVVDTGVAIQVGHGQATRLMHAADWRRRLVEERRGRFEEGRGPEGDLMDPALLAGRLIKVAPERRALILPGRGPSHRRVLNAGPSSVFIPYTIDAQASRRSALPPFNPGIMIQASGQIVFEDFYTNLLQADAPHVLTPLANATVSLYQRPLGGIGPSFLLGSTETDADGNWSIVTPPHAEGWPVYFAVRLYNTRVSVTDAGGIDYLWASGLEDGVLINFGVMEIDEEPESAQVFAVLDRAWNHVTTEGGQDPGFIAAQYPDNCLVDGSATSCWDSGDEIVRLMADTNAEPDVVLHEYGHALLHYAFGGSIGGGAHSFGDIVQDPAVAYNEGWATAFAMSVCPDGQFDWSEITPFDDYEAIQEWPTCDVSYDFARAIELFSHDGNANSNDDVSDDNREGWLHEGRVAAALTDMLDVPDDDNDGNEDRGRTGYSDVNTNDRIGLDTIYRDVMWGSFFVNYPDFYQALQGELSGNIRSLASDIEVYNYMAIPVPDPGLQCVASKVVAALAPSYADTLNGLRAFRDRILKPLQKGRGWIQTYYRHSPEMAVLLIRSGEAREAALSIVSHFAELGQAFTTNEGIERLVLTENPALPRDVLDAIGTVAAALVENGSSELRADLSRALRFLQPFHELTTAQAVRRVGRMMPVANRETMPIIRPLERAPGSRNVDWQLIKSVLPESERLRD